MANGRFKFRARNRGRESSAAEDLRLNADGRFEHYNDRTLEADRGYDADIPRETGGRERFGVTGRDGLRVAPGREDERYSDHFGDNEYADGDYPVEQDFHEVNAPGEGDHYHFADHDEPSDGHPQRFGAASSPEPVGQILRRARLEADYGLRDISGILRIRLAHLEAIEEGRYDDLPGTVYAVGFIRGYADLVGLHGDEIVRLFKREVSAAPEQSELHFPTPPPEGRLPGVGLTVIAVLLAGVAYGGWYYVSQADQNLGDFVPALPDRFAALLSGSEDPVVGGDPLADPSAMDAATDEAAGATDTSPADASSGTGSESDPATETAAATDTVDTTAAERAGASGALADEGETAATDDGAEDSAADGVALSEGPADTATPSLSAADTLTSASDDEATQSPSVLESEGTGQEVVAVPGFDDPGAAPELDDPPPPPPSADDESGAAVAAENGRIVIHAQADSWVQVRDAQGSLLMTRVMRPGETYEVPEDEGLTMVTGNAGGLDVTVDGQSVPALGNSGDVVRGIRLEPSALRDGAATQ